MEASETYPRKLLGMTPIPSLLSPIPIISNLDSDQRRLASDFFKKAAKTFKIGP